jgi:hypothetical protein
MGLPPGSRNPSENLNLPLTPGLLTKSKQGSPPSEPDRPAGKAPASSDSPSSDPTSPDLEVTEPFPPGLFRMPVPNRLFDEMPGLGDAALRCLLGLFRLSFRFDPKESQWTCPETWLPRRDLQEETGLSDEGTRKGLSELTEEGWAEVDRGGQAHRWRLRASVPTKRFTYVPTAILSRASELPTGAALRTALAVLRETWGWPREGGAPLQPPQRRRAAPVRRPPVEAPVAPMAERRRAGSTSTRSGPASRIASWHEQRGGRRQRSRRRQRPCKAGDSAASAPVTGRSTTGFARRRLRRSPPPGALWERGRRLGKASERREGTPRTPLVKRPLNGQNRRFLIGTPR